MKKTNLLRLLALVVCVSILLLGAYPASASAAPSADDVDDTIANIVDDTLATDDGDIIQILPAVGRINADGTFSYEFYRENKSSEFKVATSAGGVTVLISTKAIIVDANGKNVTSSYSNPTFTITIYKKINANTEEALVTQTYSVNNTSQLKSFVLRNTNSADVYFFKMKCGIAFGVNHEIRGTGTIANVTIL